MRLTFMVSTARREGFMRLPLLKDPASSYFTGGRLDEARVRGELGRLDCVQFSSRDDTATIIVVMDILDRVKTVLDGYEGTSRKCDGSSATASEERMERGRYATVRLDVSRHSGGYRIAMRVSSPDEVPVAGSVSFAGMLAQMIADNVVAFRDDMAKERRADDPEVTFTLVEGVGCEGVFARSEKRNASAVTRRRIRDEYAACERRHDCRTRKGLKLCSPCRFDCPCFRDGGVCAYDDIVAGTDVHG